jgi:predicted ATPase
VHDWIWKGEARAKGAKIKVVVDNPKGPQALRYQFTFAEKRQRFELTDERIENEKPDSDYTQPYFFFKYQHGQPYLNVKGSGERKLLREEIDPAQSILSQRKDPDQYPELTYLGQVFGQIRLYREWSFGRHTLPRLPQKADLPNDLLEENARNLGLVLNQLKGKPKVKKQLLDALCKLYEGVTDFNVHIEGGTVQVFFEEGNITVPATRLSDGTLRYLCLLAILCHPKPPPLVCIEEPELGLHPDILPTLADLLRDASERCQLIVTTHSDALVDALTNTPDSVIVCEKHEGQTELHRLNKEDLSDWLKRYSLGELWRKGELGGNRW